jgi:manganese efflux pump family protein
MTDQVKPNWVEKLKTRWQLKSNFQLFLVIVLFSITGSMSIKVARPILEFLGITQDMPPYFYWPLRILIVFPTYQMLFMIFGIMLGQREFAWRFEKKMLSGLGRLVGIKPNEGSGFKDLQDKKD